MAVSSLICFIVFFYNNGERIRVLTLQYPTVFLSNLTAAQYFPTVSSLHVLWHKFPKINFPFPYIKLDTLRFLVSFDRANLGTWKHFL